MNLLNEGGQTPQKPKKSSNFIVDLIFNNIKIVFLLFLFLVIFGSMSLSSMQRQGFPEVLVNVASVSVVYPNASAEQIEDQILIPLEAALSDLDDVTEYQTFASDSFGSAFVTFDQKADLDTAFTELKNEVSGVTFPEDANEPKVEKFSAGGDGAFFVAVSGFDDVQELYENGKLLKEELQSIDGVKEVSEMNELTPEVLIVFNEEKLDEHSLTRAQVEDLVRSSQLSLPVGSYDTEESSVSIILEKELTSLESLQELRINEDVRLQDVAEITTRLNNNGSYNRIGFRTNDNLNQDLRVERALLLAVAIDDSADIIEVAELIDETTESLTEDAKTDAESGEDPVFLTVYSQADATQEQIDEITQSIFGGPIDDLGPLSFLGYLVGGLALVVILLFAFMNLRVAIMAALAIPLSLFFAAIYLNLSGIDLNTLVLFSMVLAVGLVVDPTIVFLESMQRFKAQGFTGREAASKTVGTVGLGVFLAVATNILVFVPFGVVSGFFGEIIKYIPATIIPAMLASMVLPVIFFMPLASKILSAKKNDKDESGELAGTWRLSRLIGKGINWLLGAGKLKIGLRIVVFLVAVSMPFVVGFGLIGSGAVEVVQFSEQDDSDFLVVNADVSDEWTFDTAVERVAMPVQGALAQIPEIKNFTYFSQSGNSYSLLVTLHPIAERAEKDMRTSDEVAVEINREIEELNLDATVEASTSSEGPPQDEYPIRVRLYGNDSETLALAAADIKTYLTDVDGVNIVEDNISQGSSGGSVTFVLDNEQLLNQNPFFVYSLWSERLAENDLGTISLEGDTYDLLSIATPEVTTEETLTSIRITPTQEEIAYEMALAEIIAFNEANPETPRDPNVELVKPAPLYVEDLIAEQRVRESETIQRLNGNQYVEVYASVNDDADALAIQADLEEYVNDDKLAEYGLPSSALDTQGSADSIEESFTDLFIALAIAIFMIYVLLVGFFRSYLEPFIILFAIPLGLVGVFGAVAATTGQLGFLELLGVVAMAGIVVNVTILLIDYANQLKRSGKSPAEAISTSVAVRFRPIVLTQLTAFGSLIPLVYLSPFWKGLAAAIIFGIISSALLSLFVTPILYLWANSITRGISKIPSFAKRFHIAFKKTK